MMRHEKSASAVIFILFAGVSTALPLFSFEGYSLVQNTTSHLGAQGSPNAWIMNVVFILLGMRSVQVTYSSRIPYIQIFGSAFGLSLVMTGIFRHAPLVDNVTASMMHDFLHSVFATLTGFSFTLIAAGHGFMSHGRQRALAFIMAAVATAVPVLMIVRPELMGLSQRFMFFTAFLWLFFYYKPAEMS